MVSLGRKTICRLRSSLLCLLAPVKLLLQHDAVHAGLEEGKYERCLAFELAQAVEDFGSGLGRHCVEDGCKLFEGRKNKYSKSTNTKTHIQNTDFNH